MGGLELEVCCVVVNCGLRAKYLFRHVRTYHVGLCGLRRGIGLGDAGRSMWTQRRTTFNSDCNRPMKREELYAVTVPLRDRQ